MGVVPVQQLAVGRAVGRERELVVRVPDEVDVPVVPEELEVGRVVFGLLVGRDRAERRPRFVRDGLEREPSVVHGGILIGHGAARRRSVASARRGTRGSVRIRRRVPGTGSVLGFDRAYGDEKLPTVALSYVASTGTGFMNVGVPNDVRGVAPPHRGVLEPGAYQNRSEMLSPLKSPLNGWCPGVTVRRG